MKSFLGFVFVVLLLVNGAFSLRDWRTGGSSTSNNDDDGDDIGGNGRRGFGSSRPCLFVRGYVRCGDDRDKHDEKTVVVRFVDGLRGVLDEGYTSKHGYFELHGCTMSSGALKPELHVLHQCKSNQPRRLKVAIPEGVTNEFNITNVIDLKAFYQEEEAYDNVVKYPCDPL